MTNLQYNGQLISQRVDGYINGTEMAKANQVRINDWTRTDDFERYRTAISAKTGIPAMVLVETSRDSTGTATTWLHPDKPNPIIDDRVFLCYLRYINKRRTK